MNKTDLQNQVHAFTRTTLDDALANIVVTAVDDGTVPLPALTAYLQTAAWNAAAPALAVYDFFIGATPSSAGEDYLTNFLATIQQSGFSFHNSVICLASEFVGLSPLTQFIHSLNEDQFAAWEYPVVFGSVVKPSDDALAWIRHDEEYYSQEFSKAAPGVITDLGKFASIGGVLALNMQGLGWASSPDLKGAATAFLALDAHGNAPWGKEMFAAVGR
jgi:hypothetical protein